MTNEHHPIFAKGRMEARIARTVASAILLAAACKEGPEDESRPLIPGDAGGPVEYRSGGEDSGVHGDTQVLQVLLTVHDIEVKRARGAVEKAVDADTRQLATLIATDHAASSARLREIAEKKRITLEPSGTNGDLRSEARDVESKLASRTGLAFDRVYLEAEIMTHLKAMALIDHDLALIVIDPDLAQAVQDARADTMHRERAQELWRALPRDASAPSSESVSTSYVDSGEPDVSPPASDAGRESNEGAASPTQPTTDPTSSGDWS